MNSISKMTVSAVFLGAILLLSACQALGPSGPRVDTEWSDPTALVLHNGTLITATGDAPINKGAVLIQEGLITAVGPENKVSIPHDATIIDVEGRTIMPGLIDARASDLLNRLEVTDGQIGKNGLEFLLQSALQAGVTTVRATGWDWEKQQEIAHLRAALESHGNNIPTFVIAGTSLTHKDGTAFTTYYPHQTIGVISIEETRQATERLIELGVDQINLLMSTTRDAGAATRDPSNPTLSQEQLENIVEIAHNHGKWVVVQAIFKDEAEVALAAGVDELANWPSQAVPLSDDLIQELVDKAVPVVSGFSVAQPLEGDVRRFLDAGGTLVFGTFAPNGQDLASAYLEFNRMSQHQMTPVEIVKSATIHAAQALELGDVTGSLEPGKEADIIVIDGDLFENIRDVKNVVYVINNGELIAQPDH